MRQPLCRLMALFPVLATLLLSACVTPPPASDGPTVPSQAAQTASAAPVPSQTAEISPAVTDGNSGVKTDFSVLTPYKPPAEKYTRLKNGPLPGLVPGNYGTLLPYVGETMYNEWGYIIRKYGLVTTAGMIVTDPVYANVFQGSYYDNTSPNGVNLPFLTLEMLSDTIDEGAPWNSGVYAACALDGSWVTPFDYKQIFYNSHVLLLVRDFDDNDIDIMDYSGTLLYNTTALPCYNDLRQASAYLMANSFGDGIFSIPLPDGRTVFLEALTGDVTYTDYTECGAFSGGVAAAKKNDLFGLIDTSYTMVVPPQFAWLYRVRGGKSIVQYPDGLNGIVDDTGTALIKTQHSISQWDSSTFVVHDGNTAVYYDYNLKKVWSGDAEIVPVSDGWYFYSNNDGVTLLRGDAQYPLPGVTGVNSVSGNLVIVYKNDNMSWKEGLMTLEGDFLLPLSGKEDIVFNWDKDGNTFVIAYSYDFDQSFKVYDSTGGYLFSGNGYAEFVSEAGLFKITDDMSFHYTDIYGKDVFSISLMIYVPD